MSEKLAKKLGEVLAFARCDRETFEKARVALTSAFNDGHQSILDSFIAEIVQIESFASATTIEKSSGCHVESGHSTFNRRSNHSLFVILNSLLPWAPDELVQLQIQPSFNPRI